MALTHLGCPACGGTLSLAEGQRVVTCLYCGGENLVLIPDAISRYVVAIRISKEEARAAAQQFLARPGLPRALREQGRIQDVTLCYLPFYEFTGTRLGTFLLREREKPPAPDVGGKGANLEFQRWLLEPPVEKEDTRVIEQDYVRVAPACDLPELGVDRIRLEGLRRGSAPVALEPYDLVTLQSCAVVLAPTKAPARFADDAQLRMRVRGDRTGFVEQRLKLLYYPVWQARYRHRGRLYDIAVDGVTGTVLRARAPVEVRHAAALAVVALALAALAFGRPARGLVLGGLAIGQRAGWVFGTLGVLFGLILGGAVALLFAWLGWTTFRRGGEVLFSEDAAEPVLGGGPGAGGLESVRATVAGWLLALGRQSSGRG